ncbi:MAG TPA: ATP-binding protein [Rhizomicrobium sp.]|nr:ATP-binding protein [Rhizomicrobium sp.]
MHWGFIQSRFWPLAIGMALAGLVALVFGPAAFGILLALGIVAAVLSGLLAPETPSAAAAEAIPPGAALSPLARAVIAQLPAPVMLLDESERVLLINDAMRTLVGGEVENKHVSAVLRNPSVLAAIDQTAHDGEPSTVQFTLPVPIERHFQAYVARVSATPPTIALLLHDLTAIRRSERMRADFVANASHELRTPLAAVSGFIDTLRGHAKDDEEAREKFLGIMAVEAARMRRLIDDLLSLTRIEMNEHVPPQTRIQLENVVREVAAALAPLARGDHIAIEVSGQADLPPVAGDRDELIQLFQNLIHNAIKYGREDGHIWISFGQTGDGQVFASVRDDGEGIAPSAVPRLTERFYRVDVKRSREKGGTGLGLAIVKHIVSRHQGRLQIESRQGEGSSFTVLLPPAPAETSPKVELTGAPSAVSPAGVTEML